MFDFPDGNYYNILCNLSNTVNTLSTKREQMGSAMLDMKRILSRKADNPPSQYMSCHIMYDIIGSTMHVAVIVIMCVVFAFLFLPAVSQSKDTMTYPYRPSPYVFDTLHCAIETVDGMPFRFDESVVTPQGIFEVDPSLFPNGGGRDLPHPAPLGMVFFIDDDLNSDQERTEIIGNRSFVEEMFIPERLKTLTEIPIPQCDVSPPQERRTYNPSHDILLNRLTVYPESPEEPVLQRSYHLPVVDPGEKSYGAYDESLDLKEGGSIKLSLPVRWSREEKKRTGIFPDTIYVGTDFDYRGIAQRLASWKSGNSTLSSDLNRIGSEWMDTRSGYIYFEWQLWE